MYIGKEHLVVAYYRLIAVPKNEVEKVGFSLKLMVQIDKNNYFKISTKVS